MKTIIAVATAVAALATVSVASAHDSAGGHWEWRTQSSSGPRAIAPSRVRVWVKDEQTSMANCDCAMMKADASDCMMSMPGRGRAPSAG
jgi:hypothetical protein